MRVEKVPRAEYIEEIHDFNKSRKPKAPEKGDRFIGFEFEIKGNCPFLYLQNENDIHTWKVDNKDGEMIWVHCAENAYNTPINLHRKIFWDKKKPRRIISDNHIQDSQFKLKREVNKNQITELLIAALDRTFLKRLDEELM